MDISCIAKCSDALKFYADCLHDWSLVTTGLRFKCASILRHCRSAVGTDTLQMQYRYAAKSYCVNIELWRLSTSLLHQFKKFKLRYPEQILKFFTDLKMPLATWFSSLSLTSSFRFKKLRKKEFVQTSASS